MDIKIVVAAHKEYTMPQDSIYLPLHVGKNGAEGFGFEGDDTGDNISHKNDKFCELTALYWAYKNLDADYVGLAHYRRHFSLKPKKDVFSSVLSRREIEPLLEKCDVILPKKQNYYIENLYSHYAHTHDESHLEVLKDVLREIEPEYLSEFERLKKRTSAHMFNMLIMKKEILNEYCDWLFKVVFEVEKRIDTSKMSDFDKRLFGRLSELLLDVWINKNGIKYCEVPVVYTEKINLFKKAAGFLKAKFFGKSYNKSFK